MIAMCYIERLMGYLGIDIGGTFIKAGLVDETGRVFESRKTVTAIDDLNAFVSNLSDLIREFQKTAAIDGVGLGIPGLHDSKTGVIETSPNIPCLKNVNLEQLVANQVQLRCVGENDANAAAYAEFVCGAGVGLQHLAHLTLGTGLGSGVVLNGSLFTGTSGYAAEFGHTVLRAKPGRKDEGRLCACGNRGCVEAFVSATGIVTTAKEHGMPDPLTSEAIYEAAVRGNATAMEVFRETGEYLGIACANLINLLNLELIVIGGGVMASGDLLLETARRAAQFYAFSSSFRDCRIEKSKLWPDAGVIGAAMLARDR
jgi:glucokinase